MFLSFLFFSLFFIVFVVVLVVLLESRFVLDVKRLASNHTDVGSIRFSKSGGLWTLFRVFCSFPLRTLVKPCGSLTY